MLKTLVAVAALFAMLIGPAQGQDNGLMTLPSNHGAAETLKRLDKALADKGFKVFTHIDHAAAAKEFGLTMPPATVVVFGNPKGGTPNFLKKPTLAIDLPLKMLVWEDAEGKAFVTYNTGAYVFGTIFGRHGMTPPQAVADSREKLFNGLATAATQ